MKIDFKSPADYVVMPWRNGQGTTTELARLDHKDLENFVWRISRADILANGPFSHFDGMDRILFLTSGKGLLLNAATGKVTLNKLYESIKFPGDKPTVCTLIDGPCQDLNIIFSRRYVTVTTKLHKSARKIKIDLHPNEQIILLAVQGDWTLADTDQTHLLGEENLAIISNQSNKFFYVSGTGALLQIDILSLSADTEVD